MNILIISIFAMTFASVANAQFKTESYLRVKLGKGAAETILLTDSLLDGEKAYFASYAVDGKLVRKTLIDKSTFDTLVGNFEKTVSEQRQREIETQFINCGQPLELKRRKAASVTATERRLCLDSATAKEQHAIGQWWRSVRTMLRL